MHKQLFVLALTALIFWACATPSPKAPPAVRSGLDRVSEYDELFSGKRVGIITNHTAYNAAGEHISKIFSDLENVEIAAFFGPEHGIRGQAEAGAEIDSATDPLKNIPIYSLYGETRKPTPEMLADVDMLVFDIQDVGARFYTYIYTMAYAMEAAAEQGKPFVVLDRPNPITGSMVEGNVLDTAFATFVGLYPIPVRHGMTVGELAKMFNGEGWLANGVQADLTVIPLKNWRRSQWFDETGLAFIKPSPNIPTVQTTIVYPGTCLIEGTNLSEGRGTTMPFEILGAPWVDAAAFAEALNKMNFPGVTFTDTTFTPVSMPGASENPKQQNKICGGVRLVVTDRDAFMPYQTGVHIVNTLYRLYPDSLRWYERHFDRLCGTDLVRQTITGSGDVAQLIAGWQPELAAFMEIRGKYLVYE